MQTKVTIKCLCGREVALEFIVGQYLDEYRGDCECGRKWFLKELSEVLAEIDDC
jgi:hypothetical protein